MLETKKYKGLVANTAGTALVESGIQEGHVTTVATVLVPQCFTRMVGQQTAYEELTDKKLAHTCMEGNSLFCKYLSMKVQIDYPDGAYAPQQTARPVQLIWGWVNPMNLTPYTTPTNKTVTTAQIIAHISNAIEDQFNQQLDSMAFHDKQKRIFNVIGRHTFLPDMRMQAPSRVTYLASASKMQYTVKWPMNKKVNYTTSSEGLSPGSIGDEFMYPNEAYLPFCLLHNPDQSFYDGTGDDFKVEYKWNDCMWYNDA